MDKTEVIQILKDLQSYIDEEWDSTDPEINEEIQINYNALQFAIDVLKTSDDIVGQLNINNKKYIIFEKK